MTLTVEGAIKLLEKGELPLSDREDEAITLLIKEARLAAKYREALKSTERELVAQNPMSNAKLAYDVRKVLEDK